MSEIAAAEFIDVYILTISAHIHCLSLFSNSYKNGLKYSRLLLYRK